jgi:hypothetical protein
MVTANLANVNIGIFLKVKIVKAGYHIFRVILYLAKYSSCAFLFEDCVRKYVQ